MPIIQRTNKIQNLDRLIVDFDDTSPNSSDFFNVFRLPSEFPAGKTAFLINGSTNLEHKSEVRIEVLDPDRNVIYSQPMHYLEGVSRLISIFVYPTDAFGEAILTLIGKTIDVPLHNRFPINRGQITGQRLVRWQKKILINPSLENTSKIRFYKTPIISVTEDLRPYLTRTFGGDSGSYEFVDGTISGKMAGDEFILTPNNFDFHGRMVGAKVFITAPILANPAQTGSTPVTITSYTSSIVRVINTKAAVAEFAYQIQTDAQKELQTIEQKVFQIPPPNTFDFITSPYTMSVLTEPTFSATQNIRSFARVNVAQMSPFSGDVHLVKLYMKSEGTVGDYELIADQVLESKEILIDSSSLKFNVPTGQFIAQATIDSYWSASVSDASVTTPNLVYNSTKIVDSMHITGSNDRLIDGKFYRIDNILPVDFDKNAEYTFEAEFHAVKKKAQELISPYRGFSKNETLTNVDLAKIKVYVSGSAFIPNSPGNSIVGEKSEFGKLIQEIELASNSIPGEQTFGKVSKNFIADNTGNGRVIFIIEAGEWHIRDISIKFGQETGFSPDLTTFYVPIRDWQKFDPIRFKAEFYDVNNNKATVFSTSSDIVFEGGNSYIGGTNNLITGSLFIGNVTFSGIEMGGASSAFIRTVGYRGYVSASDHDTPGGFMLWSGSVLTSTTDEYGAVGLEVHGGSGSAIHPDTGIGETHALRFRTDTGVLEITGAIQATFISASAGEIGGFTISGDALAGATFLLSGSATGNEFFISASGFNVKANGDLTASNALISGTIQATSGEIGGFTITADALSGNNFFLSGSATGNEFFISSSNFNVKANGDITGSSVFFDGGTIGGWQIGDTFISSSDGGLDINSLVNTGPAIILRSGSGTNNLVTMFYTNPNLWGLGGTVGGATVFQLGSTNQIAGWTFTDSFISSSNLRIDSGGTIQTGDFVSDLKGWKITSDFNGYAEFENAKIRGSLSTTTFIKESVNAVGGQLWIANATVLTGSETISFTETTWSVENASGWITDEIALVKKFTNTGFFTEYIRIESSSLDGDGENDFNGKIYVERYLEGGSPFVTSSASGSLIGDTGSVGLQEYFQGQTIVSTGLSGSSGYIRLNANPRDFQTPYIDIIERTGSGVHDLDLKVRLGDLKGLSPSLLFGEQNPGFGIYTENGYFKGAITAVTGTFTGKLHVGLAEFGRNVGGNIGYDGMVMDAYRDPGLQQNYWITNNLNIDDNVVFRAGDQNNFLMFSQSIFTFSASNTALDRLGNFTASNALIEGEISASTGIIGGWSIANSQLQAGTLVLSGSTTVPSIEIGQADDVRGYDKAGIFLGMEAGVSKLSLVASGSGGFGDEKFLWDGSTLTISGTLQATDGNIGGWTIANDQLVAGSMILSGSATVPSIQIGQGTTKGFAQEGIFLGIEGGTAKFSVVSSNDQFLKWDGSAVAISSSDFSLDAAGHITASDALFLGQTLVENTIYRKITINANNKADYFTNVSGSVALPTPTYSLLDLSSEATGGGAVPAFFVRIDEAGKPDFPIGFIQYPQFGDFGNTAYIVILEGGDVSDPVPRLGCVTSTDATRISTEFIHLFPDIKNRRIGTDREDWSIPGWSREIFGDSPNDEYDVFRLESGGRYSLVNNDADYKLQNVNRHDNFQIFKELWIGSTGGASQPSTAIPRFVISASQIGNDPGTYMEWPSVPANLGNGETTASVYPQAGTEIRLTNTRVGGAITMIFGSRLSGVAGAALTTPLAIHGNRSNIGIGVSDLLPQDLGLYVSGSSEVPFVSGEVDADRLNTIFHNFADTAGETVGVGFSADDDVPTSNEVGAAIVHERVGLNSQGKLHFATKNDTTSGGNLPIALTIDESQKVGIGTTAPLAPLHSFVVNKFNPSQGNGRGDFYIGDGNVGVSIGVANAGSGRGISRIWCSGGDERLIFGNVTSSDVFEIRGDGGIHMNNLLAAAASTDVNINGSSELHSVTSARRYKRDITDIEIDTSKLYNLRPTSFIHIGSPEHRTFGLIAEEVLEEIPQLVVLNKKGQAESVKYSMLSVILLNELKKLKTENDSFEERLKVIEEKVGL